jgi:hypothetical protein
VLTCESVLCSDLGIQKVQEGQGGERDCDTAGGSVASRKTSGSEKAREEASQDYQKGYPLPNHARMHWTDMIFCAFPASKARQVKRGVKEVVKGIRKGEKGYVLDRVDCFCYYLNSDMVL